MSVTSAADYPALGFDPTPGDVVAVTDLSTTLSGVSTAMQEIADVLHGADDGDWRGHAAIAFRDLLDDDVRPKVDKVNDAFHDAHRCLAGWSTSLAGFQSRARTLEREAQAAQTAADRASHALGSLPAAPRPGDPPPTTPQAQQKAAADAQSRSDHQTALNSANDQVAHYRQLAHQLHDEYVDSGDTVAKQLQHAIDIAPEEPGWFDSIVDSIGDFFDSIGDLIADLGDLIVEFCQKFAPLLKLIGDIAGLLSTVLGLLAFIPGLQFLAVPALILGGVALLAHYMSAVGTTGSFTAALTNPDVLMDAAGLVLGLGALKLGNSLVRVARVAGNTRMVPQVVGPATEVPLGMFAMANGARAMGNSEFGLRLALLHGNYAGGVLTTVGAPGSIGTIKKIFTGHYGAMTNKPVVQ